jgi:galactokinase
MMNVSDASHAAALAAEFSARFPGTPRVFSAPGRVNLIGEHTDYNDGFVLPLAIEARTYVAGSPRADRRVRVYSAAFDGSFEFDLDAARPPQPRGQWYDYVEGTARTLEARGFSLSGVDLSISSTVPAGAGLSASAALEVSVGYALLRLSGHAQPGRLALALAAQTAEHDYVGTRCGIMDQYISALALSDQALLVDCRSLEARPVPLTLGTRRIVVCDTRVRHALASSEYNRRRSECEQGVALLAAFLPSITALRDVSESQLSEHASALPPVVLRRCRHVVSENARTLQAVQALERGDLSELGALMTASHRSLRDDYEVSCPELDLAVDTALAVPGVYGARMTGGGFGGCSVSLVEAEAVPRLFERLAARFDTELGTKVGLFATLAYEGVREHAL